MHIYKVAWQCKVVIQFSKCKGYKCMIWRQCHVSSVYDRLLTIFELECWEENRKCNAISLHSSSKGTCIVGIYHLFNAWFRKFFLPTVARICEFMVIINFGLVAKYTFSKTVVNIVEIKIFWICLNMYRQGTTLSLWKTIIQKAIPVYACILRREFLGLYLSVIKIELNK